MSFVLDSYLHEWAALDALSLTISSMTARDLIPGVKKLCAIFSSDQCWDMCSVPVNLNCILNTFVLPFICVSKALPALSSLACLAVTGKQVELLFFCILAVPFHDAQEYWSPKQTISSIFFLLSQIANQEEKTDKISLPFWGFLFFHFCLSALLIVFVIQMGEISRAVFWPSRISCIAGCVIQRWLQVFQWTNRVQSVGYQRALVN